MFHSPRPISTTSRQRPSGALPAPLVEPLEPRQHLAADFVIHISVDGLRPDAITQLGATQLPNFYRLRNEGAITDNARTDYDYSITLPNHTDMVTGHPVNNSSGIVGHNWTTNVDPSPGQTIHSNKGAYVPSAWDVVHDSGLRTALYASKTKFSLYDASYDADATNLQGGALDTNPTGGDNGRDKIDTYLFNGDSSSLTDSFVVAMNSNPFHYAMLHYHEPDTTGHANGWMTTSYLNSIKFIDAQLGKLLNLISGNATLGGKTTIILTADHGGTGTGHGTASDSLNYTTPFYTWGAGVDPGADVYALNAASRLNPGTARPNYSTTQPIRNGDVANLALDLLDLPTVSGSFFNSAQNLSLTAGAPQSPVVTITASNDAAAEPNNPGEFRVTRTGDTTEHLTVAYALSGAATNGTDYQSLSGLVTIPAGQTTATFSVTPIDDADIEGAESVVVTVSPDSAYTVGASASATVTIADDDVAPAPPAAPSELRARAVSRTQIDLLWTDNSNNEDGFEIEYSLDGATWTTLTTVAADTTSFSVTGLDPNTTYHFRVRAYDDLLGPSAYSNTAKTKTRR